MFGLILRNNVMFYEIKILLAELKNIQVNEIHE